MHNASSFSVLASFAAAIPAIMVSVPAVAAALAVRPFDQAAFDAAQKAGKPILVWVHAPWCPVCRKQEKTIARVTADPAYRDMQIFRIDYDTQKSLWAMFGATMQSTVIGFRGKRETARIAHETDDAKVTAVIHSAIA
jgi:thioredoxin 1